MDRTVTYRFFIHGGQRIAIDLRFDEDTYQMVIADDAPKPEWARLEHNKCDNCPLGPDTEWCPAALSMARIVPAFDAHISHEQAVVEVETPTRKVSAKIPLQRGLASLLGLVLATSGCPHTRFLRPMARFHLPFADEHETTFRSLSAHLLWLYVHRQRTGKNIDLNFDMLKENYARVTTVNGFLVDRVRNAVAQDAALNAVIILDLFATITPSDTESDFRHISRVFEIEDPEDALPGN